MSAPQILAITAAVIAILTGLTAIGRSFGKTFIVPQLHETIKSALAPELHAYALVLERHSGSIPELTAAVRELTGATTRQSEDTERLSDTLRALDGKVDTLSGELGGLAERTARIEGKIEPVKIVRRRKVK